MLGMSEEQKLYPQYIYRINQSLQEIKEECGIQENLISMSFLNFYNRKFSRLVVDDERWSFDNIICENILNFTKKNEKEWKSFLKKIRESNIDSTDESLTFFEKGPIDPLKIHFNLLNLFQAYTLDDRKYIDGIIYRNVTKGKLLLNYAIGELLVNKKKSYKEVPWIHMHFFFENSKISHWSCQESDCDVNSKNEIKKPDVEKLSDLSDEDRVYLKYLIPLFVRYKDDKGEDFKGDNFFDFKRDDVAFSKFKFLLFIPVYDALIAGKPYGNFLGNISIPFKNKTERGNFIRYKLGRMQKALMRLVR